MNGINNGMNDGIGGIIRAARLAYGEFVTAPGVPVETRQAVSQAVRFLVADLESARAMTCTALAIAE